MTNVATFDLLVIGTGPAGGQVAKDCARAGWKVAIAESREFGGTCALRGCNPKKVFVHAAETVDAARRSNGKLCSVENINIHWPDLVAFKNTFVASIPKNSRAAYEELGIKTFDQSPRFISPTQLMIGDRIVEPKHVLIATGGKPRPLNFPGEEFVTLSDQFMDLADLPKRVVFIGGGFISMEFASVANRADSQVTVLERGHRPLKMFDESMIEALMEKSAELGLDIQTHSTVQKIERNDDGAFNVTYQQNETTQTIQADLVVHGAGRTPNLSDLDLPAAGIEFDENRGIQVDQYLRTTAHSHIFAAGDCANSGSPALTPTSSIEGHTVALNLLNEDLQPVEYGPIPSVVFTIPATASVGVTQQQADDAGLEYELKTGEMSNFGSLKKICESTGRYKFIIDKKTDLLLGAHIIAPAAGDLINLLAVAMKFKIPMKELKTTLLAFPTSSYDIRQML